VVAGEHEPPRRHRLGPYAVEMFSSTGEGRVLRLS
jgi:hypothetical protein